MVMKDKYLKVLSPDKVVDLVLAACCLHNFMVENNWHSYTNALDIEDTDKFQFTSGVWRNDPQLIGLAATSGRNSQQCAKQQREDLTKYFSSK